jgi:hypothetical protein
MERFMIEVPHGSDKYDCLKTIEVFLKSGSHFLANADWGCVDGEHKAWFIIEAENRDQALMVVPPLFRSIAKVVLLRKNKLQEIEKALEFHK